MIQLSCANCQTLLSMDDAFAGGVCRCQHCGTIQTVPSPANSRSAAPQKPKALYRGPKPPAVAASPTPVTAPVSPAPPTPGKRTQYLLTFLGFVLVLILVAAIIWLLQS